jgi:hypothetical protein
VFERVVDKLLALPPAHPDVAEPAWDEQLAEPKPAEPRADASDATPWSSDSRDGDTVVGPGGTTGVLIRSDRRHALIVEDGRPVRAHSRCDLRPAAPPRPRRSGVRAHRARRRRRILDVRVGRACPLCRAPFDV